MKLSNKTEGITYGELYDTRHPVVLDRRAVKTGSSVAWGQVVKAGTDGAVEPAASGDASYYGVACENVTQSADTTHVTIVVHGTVKRDKVKIGEAELTEADVQKLKTAGIYALN